MNERYKYDVAISFLKEDESFANKLASKLKEGFECFIYNEHQEELSASDGEVFFNNVFENDSRFIVVLYREGWGESPWTRIEKTAIQNRTLNEGYSSTLFVQMPNCISMPKWLPKTYIYYHLMRFGLDGLIATINYKITENGGFEKEFSILDTVKSLNQTHEKFSKVRERLAVDDIISISIGLVDKTLNAVNEIYLEINKTLIHNKLSKDENLNASVGRYIKVRSENLSILFYWEHKFSNSLTDSGLFIEFDSFKQKGFIVRPDHKSFPEKRINAVRYEVTYNTEYETYGFIFKNNFLTPEMIANDWMKKFIVEFKEREIQKKHSS
jgi:hypothetical protein